MSAFQIRLCNADWMPFRRVFKGGDVQAGKPVPIVVVKQEGEA